MNDIKELNKKLRNKFNTDDPYKDITSWALTGFIVEIMQQHTNQALQELKEKVEMEMYAQSDSRVIHGMGKAIELIDETINE